MCVCADEHKNHLKAMGYNKECSNADQQNSIKTNSLYDLTFLLSFHDYEFHISSIE